MALDVKDQLERNQLLQDEQYRRTFRRFYADKLSPRVWQRDFGDAVILGCPDASLVGRNFAEILRALDAVLMISIGLMVGVSARALGALPVFAFSTLSAIAALVLDLRLPWTFLLATIAGALSGLGGYLFAYFYNFPVGGSQTVLASSLVVLALLARGLKQLVVRGR